jgi:hypothetical protein
LALSESCPNLEEICCQGKFTDFSVLKIAERCKKLKAFEVISNTITDATVIQLATNCPMLKRLSFLPINITQRLYEAVKNACFQLSELSKNLYYLGYIFYLKNLIIITILLG